MSTDTMTKPAAGPQLRFNSTLRRSGNVGSTTFLPVPPDIMQALAPRRRVPVVMTVNGHTWRSTISVYGDECMVPVNAEVRTAACVAPGDTVDAVLVVDAEPRVVEVPADLAQALADAGVKAEFQVFSYSHQREYLVWIDAAKRAETRASRIEKAVQRVAAKMPLK